MKRKGEKSKSPRFTMLEHEICKSEAWKNLKGSSVKLYIVLRGKAYGRFDAARTNVIKLSYNEMIKETGLSVQSVRNAILELDEKGFIDVVEQGGLKSGGYSRNSYKLCIRFLKYKKQGYIKGTLKKENNVTDRGFGLHKKWGQKKINNDEIDFETKVIADAEGIEHNEETRREDNVLHLANS
jgi:hypothetical protein